MLPVSVTGGFQDRTAAFVKWLYHTVVIVRNVIRLRV